MNCNSSIELFAIDRRSRNVETPYLGYSAGGFHLYGVRSTASSPDRNRPRRPNGHSHMLPGFDQSNRSLVALWTVACLSNAESMFCPRSFVLYAILAKRIYTCLRARNHYTLKTRSAARNAGESEAGVSERFD